MEDLFNRLAYLTGAIPGGAGNVNLRRVELIEAVNEFRAGDLLVFTSAERGTWLPLALRT